MAVVPGSAACEPFIGWALDLGACIAMGYGLILMATAIQGLMAGNNLSFGSEPVSDQIIESGPYDVVRHPLYGGAVLSALGFSLLTMDVWRLILTIGLFLASNERVSSEERYLVDMFGAKYQEYAKNVDKKLLPLLY
jgi:protein-S-isoprenylcysteine O-methyltransferase Ste14